MWTRSAWTGISAAKIFMAVLEVTKAQCYFLNINKKSTHLEKMSYLHASLDNDILESTYFSKKYSNSTFLINIFFSSYDSYDISSHMIFNLRNMMIGKINEKMYTVVLYEC